MSGQAKPPPNIFAIWDAVIVSPIACGVIATWETANVTAKTTQIETNLNIRDLIKKLLSARKEDFLAFYINLPDKEVYKRSLARSRGNMKAVYKVLDTEKIIAKRIDYHKKQVSKTVKYFQSLKKLKIINGNQPIPKVTKDILKAIEEYKKK